MINILKHMFNIRFSTPTIFLAVSSVSAMVYFASKASRPTTVNPHPHPPYVTASQQVTNPNNLYTELNRMVITSPLPKNTTQLPTASNLTQAMFTSWSMLPERIALNIMHLTAPFKVGNIQKGESLLGAFKVEHVDDDRVELRWFAFGLTGTHFICRVVHEKEGVVEWWFDTIVWNPSHQPGQKKGDGAPLMSPIMGSALKYFHVLYARLLLGDAVSRLGY